tara:strand:+ start:863 stop:1273 length:411 start_codon:yes stop_codon:yes gene_type:complete
VEAQRKTNNQKKNKMGQNSTEVAYQFGQMGSIFNDTANAMVAPTGKVFVAIHFLEDTTLEASGGLKAEQDPTNGIEFFETESAAHNAVLSPDLGESGSGGVQLDNSNTIPAGTIIYGRYTEVHATEAKMIIGYLGV